MKNFLNISTFVVTFALSIGLVGLLYGFQPAFNSSLSSNSEAAQIELFLRQDLVNGDHRQEVARQIFLQSSDEEHQSALLGYLDEGYREAISDYVEKSSNMDSSELPTDFQYAWEQHMKAWQAQAEFASSFDPESKPTEEAIEQEQKMSTEINSTWNQVLRIAQRYGVKIDASYFN